MKSVAEELKNELVAEHSKTQSEKIAKKCVAEKIWLKNLIKIILENETLLSQRAAWVLSFVHRKDKTCLLPYLPQLIDNLSKPKLHDAVKRNTLKIFEATNPPANYETKLLDLSIKFLRNKNEAIAIRVFAMTAMVNLSLLYPELQHEVKEIILEQYDEESPAYVSRAKKELKRLK
ncbi:MAG: hypothetical protein V4667_11375 [Bacteroidota bacterium]